MKKITQEELEVFLRKHKLWMSGDPKGERADLCGANLCGANLRSADLCGADLCGANLCGANLRSADLCGANLRSANLCGANLRSADLRSADLYGANLYGADLCGANLRSANLYGAENINYPIACPEKGAFIGFKQASCDYIVELLIPEDAKRCSATSRKCRCSKAKVLSITRKDGSDSGLTKIHSNYDSKFIYTVGEFVEVKNFNEDRWNECSAGIHFFITRQEAVDY